MIPPLAESITEGDIAAWLVKSGDRVEKDQAVLELAYRQGLDGPELAMALGVTGGGVLVLGLVPTPLIDAAQRAVSALG